MSVVMKGLGVVVAAFVIYPLVNEETASVCHAVESRFVVEAARSSSRQDMSAVFAMGLAGGISQGSFASGAVKVLHPNLPPFAGCYLTYYKMISDPVFTRELIVKFKGRFN